MRILVTGGTGFIGRAVVARLLAAHDVHCLVRDPRSAPEGTTPLAGDLTLPLKRSNFYDFDGIIHLAQATVRGNFPEEAGDVFAVNVGGFARLIDAARSAGIRRFVTASTGTIYQGVAPPLREDSSVAPREYYPATKLAAEILLRPYEKCMAACALRLFTPYGPGQSGRLIPQLLERIRVGSAIILVGSADGHILAPTYVDDIARVFVTALEDEWVGAYNVASPEVLTVREIGTALGRSLGVEARFEERPGETVHLYPDLSHLNRRYPPERFRTFAQGLQAMLTG
jgi:UDP-glucose 4-epimerase